MGVWKTVQFKLIIDWSYLTTLKQGVTLTKLWRLN